MRVLLDGTPLLGTRTGIGRYTAALLDALTSVSDVDVYVVGFTGRGWRQLRALTTPPVRATGLPIPARALRACWSRKPFPPVELLARPTDVVHGTNFVLPPSLRTPGVVTVHDLAFLDAAESSEQDLPTLVERSVRRARAVCTPTAAVADSVCDRFDVPRSKVIVTPLGVDAEWFDVPENPRLPGLPEDYLLFVGADGPRKALDVLLRAHAADLPPLVIAGPERAGSGQPGSDGRVVRTGYLPDDDLRRVVAGARALVLPSRDEGFGLPVLEALATGVPVACSDIAALREVSGGHAVLFPHGDVEALRDALHRVLELPRGVAADAPRRARAAAFTWDACAEATVAAYRQAREQD